MAFLTTLTGETLAKVTAGRVVRLGDLSEESRSTILTPARPCLLQRSTRRSSAGQFDPDEFLIISTAISPSRSVVEPWNREAALQSLGWSLPGRLDPRTVDTGADCRQCPTPPTLIASCLERRQTLKACPIFYVPGAGDSRPGRSYRLSKSWLPVALSRFTSPNPVKLSDLADGTRLARKLLRQISGLHAPEVGRQ